MGLLLFASVEQLFENGCRQRLRRGVPKLRGHCGGGRWRGDSGRGRRKCRTYHDPFHRLRVSVFGLVAAGFLLRSLGSVRWKEFQWALLLHVWIGLRGTERVVLSVPTWRRDAHGGLR